MRQERGSNGNVRSSALWGKPPKGETRSNALWGKGGRGLVAAVAVTVFLTTPVVAMAGSSSDKGRGSKIDAYLSEGLLEAARENKRRTFDVIVQGTPRESTSEVADEVEDAQEHDPGRGTGLRDKFRSVNGVAAQLTGRQIIRLARRGDIRAITTDAPVVLSGYWNWQRWPYVSGVHRLWNTASSANAPTIAVVDSGIDAGRADFGGRVLAEVNLTSRPENSPGDGRGHGTFVAGIAAGGGQFYAGSSPESELVSIDVMDDSGVAMTRDVIAAADWILANKDRYNIRVANFSLHSGVWGSVFFDPLNHAVEKLWFNGVVVVAAAGNYGADGQAGGVPYAPGNDPFVITVGAGDVDGSISTYDDYAAPWSAWGYTLDGFAKPDLGAPGRFMVGPVPATSTLPHERRGNVVSSGYMQLSGTSFAAPIVAGAAAQVLAVHPEWTPDQVKGALMLTAKSAPSAQPGSLGVGIVDAAAAAAVTDPPNPNAALNQFVTEGGHGSSRAFDAASWANVAQSDASWASASWASASWASASWASASWASASWASASWASASWASASWASASWASASWASSSYADNAEGEASSEGEYLDEDELAEIEAPAP
ncbi:MAG: S8 family serine peptidase [Gaiellaceae bacterium]